MSFILKEIEFIGRPNSIWPVFSIALMSESELSLNSMASDGSGNVAFVKSTEGYSKTTLDRAATAKYKLENFYKSQVQECVDREQRFVLYSFLCLCSSLR